MGYGRTRTTIWDSTFLDGNRKGIRRNVFTVSKVSIRHHPTAGKLSVAHTSPPSPSWCCLCVMPKRMQERMAQTMQQEPHLNELLNIPNRDHVLQMAQTPDVPVYDDEGNKMGKVSKRREDGMLVIHRNKLAAEHELVVPLA